MGFLLAIRHRSLISCRHINLLGEYDLSDQRLEDFVDILPPIWLHEKGVRLSCLVREILEPKEEIGLPCEFLPVSVNRRHLG